MHLARWLSSAIWPMEVVERIGEIGALGRPSALGDEELSLQPHRMVDAEHAGVAHVGRRRAALQGRPSPCLASR